MAECTDVYIVSHTHWDREWYLPFQQFRVNLAGVMQGVLDALEREGSFEHFLLDGQAILLEDHLATAPEDAERIRALVVAGRLSIGPWYVLPDEFLISPEAHVRNLLLGHEVCRAFGSAQKVGYMPDAFGHIAQMPQLLRQARIDSFVYTRGDGDDIERLGCEYIWVAPDGSEVLAIHQLGGYCNAGGLGHEEIWEAHTRRAVDVKRAVDQVRDLLARMDPVSNGPVRMLNNGCDHFPVQAEFDTILAALRREFPALRFHHTSLSAFVRAVQEEGCARGRHAGELLGGKRHPILSGVWSARMPLKQRNEEAQTLLAGCVEPLAAYVRFVHDRHYPAGPLRAAWKLLLQNHPHDSICGCSIDAVHREMETRFAGVLQAGEQLLVRGLAELAPAFAPQRAGDRETVLAVFNPLPERRTAVIDRLVVLPPGAPSEDLVLRDEEGHEVAYQVLERRWVERFWNVDYRHELSAERQRSAWEVYRHHFGPRILKTGAEAEGADTHLWIQFLAENLPPVGHRIYILEEREAGQAPSRALSAPARRDGEAAPGAPGVRLDANALENEHVRVALHPNGEIDLVDKTTGRTYPGLNLLEDSEDAGDEYDYSPAAESETITSRDAPGAVRVVTQTFLAACLEAESHLVLPLGLEPDRRRRSTRRGACPYRVRVTVSAGSPLVRIETDFDNRVEDHRLRALFPTAIATGEVVSDGHFLVQRRPLVRHEGEDWVQPPSGTYPQQGFCLVEDAGGGLAVLNRGLPEFGPLPPGPPSTGAGLALTLLRSVGWLSRDDFTSRRCKNAGPTLYTPEAQCPGPNTFRYALLAYRGTWLAAGVADWSLRYRLPPIVTQGVRAESLSGTTGLVEKVPSGTVITAIKRHQERETLVMRLCNLTGDRLAETLHFGPRITDAWQVDLLEERRETLAAPGAHRLELEIGPHAIVTVEVALAGV